MSKELLILIGSWLTTIVMLILLVPKEKTRQAHVIFFFKQAITWPIGLFIVEIGLIKYPVREFLIATQTSFTFEYFVYPALCVIFNLYYPEDKNYLRKFLHYVYFSSGITIFEVILETNTLLIKYIDWAWYWTWITLFITFAASRIYYKWFFSKITVFED